MTETERTPQRSPIPPGDCNLARTFELIGDKWCLMILRSVLYGVVRFDDLQADIAITRSVLSNRLKRLCDANFLQRKSYRIDGERARTEYVATPMTHRLLLPFMALTQWADDWIDDREVKPVRFLDRDDNTELSVALVKDPRIATPLESVTLEFSTET